MSAVFHRSSAAAPPTAVSGRGCYITDAEGRT